MLHTETVEPGTLSLLKELMALPSLNSFSLVRGTALSLRYGHRSSIDLDLFFHEKFDQPQMIRDLENAFGQRFDYKQQHTFFGIFCFIDDIKEDIVYYPHQPIAPLEVEDGIRFYNSADIAAMKIRAVLGRGKKKDFWDIYELLHHFSIQQNKNFPVKCWPLVYRMPSPILWMPTIVKLLLVLKGRPGRALKKE